MRKIVTATVITIIFGLTSCESDNFYDVTKTIIASDTIELNKLFEFTVLLTNQTEKPIRLTLDKDITKSLFFSPSWFCGNEPLKDRTPNPKNQLQNLYTTYLQPKDSISFKLSGQLMSFSNNDSLQLRIRGYVKDFRLANPTCEDFKVTLEGMWIPGDGPLADAMEGYGFKNEIDIKNTANIGFNRPAAR